MMRNPIELAVAVATQPWALTPSALGSLAAWAEGPMARESIDARRPVLGQRGRGGGGKRQGRTAVISVNGTLTQRMSFLEMLGMGTSCATISAQLADAMADSTVDRVLFDIDSDGGSVFGVDELATEIRNARAVKPIIGVANSVAASAAYWLLAQCSEAYVTPGGQVGGIGIVTEHQDRSGEMAKAGIYVTFISAGRFKTEGNPFEPLSPAARAHMQATVDAYGTMFVNAVAKGRKVSADVVRRNFGQGRTMRSQDAIAFGLVDGEATLSELLTLQAGKPRPRISAQAFAAMPPGLAKAMRDLESLQ